MMPFLRAGWPLQGAERARRVARARSSPTGAPPLSSSTAAALGWGGDTAQRQAGEARRTQRLHGLSRPEARTHARAHARTQVQRKAHATAAFARNEFGHPGTRRSFAHTPSWPKDITPPAPPHPQHPSEARKQWVETVAAEAQGAPPGALRRARTQPPPSPATLTRVACHGRPTPPACRS